jgi:uncharacterized protein YneF (UPF0154 family)
MIVSLVCFVLGFFIGFFIDKDDDDDYYAT